MPIALALPGLLGLASLPATAQVNERYVLRADLGVEYDSNAHRSETLADAADNPTIVRSPVLRSVITGNLSDVVARGHAVAISATAGGKYFTAADARSEDVAIGQSTADWRMTLGERGSLTLSGAYYEAFQRAEEDFTVDSQRRDFRSLSGSLRVARLFGDRTEVGLGGGYRLFVFKSDHNLNFQAPVASLDLRWAAEVSGGEVEWDLAVSGSFEPRRYTSWRLVGCAGPVDPMNPCLPTAVNEERRDRFAYGRVDVTRTGAALIGLGYALSWNDSNSYGESVVRHGGIVRFGLGLALDLYLAARADVLLAFYREPVVVGRQPVGGRMFLNIEEENRNGLRLDLSRALGDHVQLIARYSLYVNELGDSPVRFFRQTALLSLSFSLEK